MRKQNRKPSLDEVAPLKIDEGRFALHTCEWFNRWLTTKFLLATILFLIAARFFAPFIFVALALGVITIVLLLALSRNWNPIHVKDKDTGLEYDTDSLAHAWRGILPAYKKIDEENKLRAVLLSREGRLPSGLNDDTCEWVCVKRKDDYCEFRIWMGDVYGAPSTFSEVALRDYGMLGKNFGPGKFERVAQEAWALSFPRPVAI